MFGNDSRELMCAPRIYKLEKVVKSARLKAMNVACCPNRQDEVSNLFFFENNDSIGPIHWISTNDCFRSGQLSPGR